MTATIDAKTTSAALRQHVFPLLKNAGFDDRTGRKAWRRRGSIIDTIEFRSISSYDSMVFGCPTACLTVWIGSWPACFPPPDSSIKSGPKGLRPLEYEMPLRGHLCPNSASALSSQPRIWDIRSVEDADAAAVDIADQLDDCALDWLDKERAAADLLNLLETDASIEFTLESAANGSQLKIECGRSGSPAHNRNIAVITNMAGDFERAARHYEASRWAYNHVTKTSFLFLDKTTDDLILAHIAMCNNAQRPSQ